MKPPPPRPAARAGDAGARYWHDVAVRTAGTMRGAIWRVHSDAVNGEWIAQRLPSTSVDRVLKTDLHDESVADGLVPLLRGRARTVIGIDLAIEAVAAADGHDARLCGLAADVRELPFAEAAFDAVVSNSTLDHFERTTDIPRSLGELHRVLRPGGLLLLTLDNLANPVVVLRNALPFWPLNALGIVPYRIGRSCRPRELEHLVRQAGFDVVEVGAIMHCPRMLAVAVSSLLARFGSMRARERWLGRLMAFERVAAWRTRFATGYFTAVVARKPARHPSGSTP